MIAVIWIVLCLLVVVGSLWFRRTPLYRAHRRIGAVPGQSGIGAVPGQSAAGGATWYGNRHVPPLLPELRPDVDQATPGMRRWARRRRPPAVSPSLAVPRGKRSATVIFIEWSRRRSTARHLAARRRMVTQDPDLRRGFQADGSRADRIRVRSVGRDVSGFFSPGGYSHGRVAGSLACVYVAATVLVIVSAIPEDNGDTLTLGLALVATLPVSLGVLAFQGDGAWMLAALAVCALLNAFVFWVTFRGDPA